ncbi:female lethal d [Carabus blaptoides fortunei]
MFEQDSGNMVQDHELTALKDHHQHLMQLYLNSQHRGKVLLRRLAIKERLLQNYAAYELNTHESSSSTLLDPCVNLIIQLLCKEVHALKSQLKETRNELTAWQFTPDSVNGKRLMARCIKLHKENEELGRIISHGKVAKLEGELALYKSFSEEVKKSQSELDTLVQDIDEDVETMQSTIFSLAEQLEERDARIKKLESENKELQRNQAKMDQLQTASIDRMETRKLDTRDAESKAVKNIDDKNTLTIRQEFQKLLED